MKDILEEYPHVRDYGEAIEMFLWAEAAVKEIIRLRAELSYFQTTEGESLV